jgi:hypothetical protein
MSSLILSQAHSTSPTTDHSKLRREVLQSRAAPMTTEVSPEMGLTLMRARMEWYTSR